VKRRAVVGLLWLATLAAPGAAAAEGWGWMGVRIRELSEQEVEEISIRHGIREGYGALIVEVLKETPAARSGLKDGDLVVAFNDRPIVDTRSLQRFVARTPIGQEVSLTVFRTAEGRRQLPIRLGRMPPDVVAERVAAEFGFLVREASPDAGLAVPATPVPTVTVVLKGSQADRAELRPGDTIVEVNGRAVTSRQALTEALQEVTLERPLSLTVRRGEERRRLTLSPPASRIP
jgi:serine protease Do